MKTSEPIIKNALWQMIEAGGRTAETFGISRLFGQIYTLLYLKNEPLSLDQIVEELAVSKASVSIACRQMQAFGAIKRTTRRGDRRDFYGAVQDFRGLIHDGLLPIIEKKLESARVQIDQCSDMLDKDDSSEASRLQTQLKNVEERRAKISDLLKNPLIKRML